MKIAIPWRKIFIHLVAETKCHLCCDNKKFQVPHCRFSTHLWSNSWVIGSNSPCNPLNAKNLGSKYQTDIHNIISGKTSMFFLSPHLPKPPQMLEKQGEIPVISYYCEGQPGWENCFCFTIPQTVESSQTSGQKLMLHSKGKEAEMALLQ